MVRKTLVAGMAVSSVLGLLSGCSDLTTVVVPAESEIEVPGAGILAGNPLVANDVFPAGALSDALAQSIAQTFDTAGYNKDAVDSLTLTKLTMTVIDPNEGDRQLRGLGFVEALTIAVSAEGVDAVIAAQSDAGAFDGAPGPASYDMPVTNNELVGVFKAADQMNMDADLEPSEPPQFTTTVKFETELTIQVNVVGALGG
jgi:hypothetical protein